MCNCRLYLTIKTFKVNIRERLNRKRCVFSDLASPLNIVRQKVQGVPLFTVTVSLNITLLACSLLGLISCVLLILGVYKVRYTSK